MASGGRGGRGRTLARAGIRVAIVVGILAFAVEGGEFGTADIISQRSQRRALAADVDTLTRVVDSLLVWNRALETDPLVQERVAREEFGMVRGDKELLYRFVEPRADSGR